MKRTIGATALSLVIFLCLFNNSCTSDDNITTKENINSKHKDLPKNVNIAKNKAGKIIGYTGKVIINKVPHVKMFIKVSVPMEEKLKQATDYVNSILNK